MTEEAGGDLVRRAHDAASRSEWQEAFELFTAADSKGLVGVADLPILAGAAYAAGHLDMTVEAWERAYAHLLEAGDAAGAAGAAVRVAMHLLFDTALMAPVRGWLVRAEQLLEGRPETAAHAWFAVVRAYERIMAGDRSTALGWARRAIDAGARHDPAACAIGRVAEARILILDGDDVDKGLALLDEAGMAAVSGELDPMSTGVAYCELVCALQGLAQYDRAEEWTEAMDRWSRTNAIGSLHGRCRVHRAEILRQRGSWDEAEAEATRACQELRPYLRRELGWPLTELGRIRLGRGDIKGAEEALLEASRAGWDPEPELARLRLAQGDAATAAALVRSALERPRAVPSKELPPHSDLRRAPLLEAQVEIEIAAGDIDRARSAAEALHSIAARFRSTALAASATAATERLRAAELSPSPNRPVAELGGVFRREGDYWSVVYGGRTVRLRDLKGMRYLAILLAAPGREFHVLDLVASEAGGRARVDLGDAGEILDDRAKAAYRRRLSEIDADLDEARATGDAGRAEQATAERDFLVRELACAVGLGGRGRRVGSASERARVAVTRAVRQSLARIGDHQPELGQHLDRSIRTGTYCAYLPDPRTPVNWET